MSDAGYDRAVGWAALNRGWAFISGPVSALLIAGFLSSESQGYYYTFLSLVAMQSFVELGFSIVIVQFASHEWAGLSLGADGRVSGGSEALSRLAGLLRLTFAWYAAGALVLVAGVGCAGGLFLARHSGGAGDWGAPWAALVVLAGASFCLIPLQALLEGCHQLEALNRWKLAQAVLYSLALWGTMASGGGLWAPVAAYAVSFACVLALTAGRYREFFISLLRAPCGPRLDWGTQLWPMQWRLAVGGVVAYFTGNWFVPVTFHYHGAAEAGRMGMTLSLVGALGSFASTWVQTHAPRFGALVARKEYAALDALFNGAVARGLAAFGLGSAGLFMTLKLLRAFGHALPDRLLPAEPLSMLLAATGLLVIGNAGAAYLRAHRREVLLPLGVATGAATAALTWGLGRGLGAPGIAAGHLAVQALINLPGVVLLWRRCRREWHEA